MEAETTMSDYKYNLDKNLRNVMPDSWEGHGRMAIRESDVISPSVEQKAIEKMNNIVAKSGKKPERAANALIKTIAEKQD